MLMSSFERKAMVVVRFLEAQKTILQWLLIGAFIQTGDVIDGRIRHL